MAEIVSPADRREFVRSHGTGIFAYRRRSDGPAMCAVHYVMDGDDILISTMHARAKARAVARDPKVSLCVLDEQWPPTYLTVYCDAVIDATVDTDLEAVMDVNRRIPQAIAGRPVEHDRAEASRLNLQSLSITAAASCGRETGVVMRRGAAMPGPGTAGAAPDPCPVRPAELPA